jgi:dienelactone hydrolase
MRTAYRLAAIVVAVIFLIVLMPLAHYQNGAPPHEDRSLPGGEPATFYLPGTSNQPGPDNPFFQTFPKPGEQRPPAVVLVHGFSSDRVNSSALARRIAQNGYGVLAIDVRGHGENRNSFLESQSVNGLREDVKNAVEFLRQSSLVDGSRIVVMGHSMGAGATLDYATHDPNIKGSVMISGGFNLDGPEHPRNTLFIFAENDPGFIKETSAMIAAHVAGADKLELGKVYGDFASGTAAEAIEVKGVNHVTIMWSADAAQSIVRWLDGVCGVKRAGDPNLVEPRLSLILVCLALFILLLIPIGRVCAALTPAWERRPAGSTGWVGLGALVIALFAAMALNTNAPQATFLSMLEGHIMMSWLAIAGGLLLGLIAIEYPDDLRRMGIGLGATLFAAALAFGAIIVIGGAYDVALHRTALTPERLLVTVASALLILPFFVSFELMLRRGPTLIATVLASIGRVLIVVTIVAGLGLGTIPFVLGLVLPLFVVLFAMFEIFAASVYSVSGNLLLIAIVEALWFARTAALSWPITFKF